MPWKSATFFLFIVCILLSGCSKPPMMVDRVLVQNATDMQVVDVKLHHEPTNRIGEVSSILPQKSLDIGFPKQPLLARQAKISWRDGLGVERDETLEIPYQADEAEEGRAMSLIYIIHSSGVVSAHLQDSYLTSP